MLYVIGVNLTFWIAEVRSLKSVLAHCFSFGFAFLGALLTHSPCSAAPSKMNRSPGPELWETKGEIDFVSSNMQWFYN